VFQQVEGQLQSLGVQGTPPRQERERMPDAHHPGRRTACRDQGPDGLPGGRGVPGQLVPGRGRQGGGWDGGGHGCQAIKASVIYRLFTN